MSELTFELEPDDPDYDAKYLAALRRLVLQQGKTIEKLSATQERANDVNRECLRQRDEARAERDALVIRRDELLATIVRVTNETPFPDEMKGWTEQRAKLVAEVGTLKAASAERDRLLADCARKLGYLVRDYPRRQGVTRANREDQQADRRQGAAVMGAVATPTAADRAETLGLARSMVAAVENDEPVPIVDDTPDFGDDPSKMTIDEWRKLWPWMERANDALFRLAQDLVDANDRLDAIQNAAFMMRKHYRCAFTVPCLDCWFCKLDEAIP